ncbi:YnfC family lipoprotein [Escherichia coli]
MIENHLTLWCIVVKYKLLPCLLAIFLTGCDRTEVTLFIYPSSEILPVSLKMNSILFAAWSGKRFTQTLMDEQGEVTNRVSGTLWKKAVLILLNCWIWKIIPWWLYGTGRQLLP